MKLIDSYRFELVPERVGQDRSEVLCITSCWTIGIFLRLTTCSIFICLTIFDETEIATRNARYLTSVRTLEAVISVSDFVKRDIVTQYGVKVETVSTIWNILSGSPAKRFPDSNCR